ncbi:S8 family serine peptidase [Hymenobacter volaticus]|uniref:S8 family serine peptidase n=1 Tax=Hymenobacter volaticus TaxID=2932254 RepID=A0ABY4GBK5_9BACT|nr:S8 family serine peptidase [Hymenobacter volaticus]UOQ68208.1 S8 family serine peptidase [Hymenobacter volaticus]
MLSRVQVVVLLLLLGTTSRAAGPPPTRRYWVELHDKAGVKFEPATYFHPAAQARRQRQHLPPADFTDLPVSPVYLRAVQAHADTVLFVSRWFNAVACRATAAQAAVLATLPGVQQVIELPEVALHPALRSAVAAVTSSGDKATISVADRQLARQQTRTLGADAFRRAGLDGRGLRIAIFDVGFNGADRHPAFRQLFAEKKVVASYDFVRQTTNVFHGGTHGLEVLSCLAGRLPDGTLLGLAPGAEYLLARTERMNREVYTEELDWLAAVEWADRNGADIINSSLGYTSRRYFPEDMNGRTSLVARAAELAVRKGILVVNAAGNDGDNDDWRTVGTPADADSVLAVGGVNPDTGLHLDFSAYGPSASKRLKPNVAAFGTVLAASPGGYSRIDGTSFASPLVAGFAACAWQAQRKLPVMALFTEIEQSASLYPYYDYAHGYGIPQATVALRYSAGQKALEQTLTVSFIAQDSTVAVLIRPEAERPTVVRQLPLYADSLNSKLADNAPARVAPLGREDARPTPQSQSPAATNVPAAPGFPPLPAAGYLYWHVADAKGVLRRYEVMEVSQRAVLRIPRRTLRPGDVVRVFYQGATHSYPVQ